jgi:taurine transport system permease protein
VTPPEPARADAAASRRPHPAQAADARDIAETSSAAGSGVARSRGSARPVQGSRYRAIGEGDTWAISTVTVFLLFVLWWGATRFGWIKPLFLPSPASTWRAFVDALQGRTQGQAPLLEHVLVSVLRVFSAFLLAVLTAVPVGIAMGVSRVARGVFDPVVEFYRPLPPLAYLPLIVIWLGIDESAKVTLIYLACFAPLAMAAKAGVRAVPIEQINAAYTLGATRWQVITAVILPAALPEILTGMRIAIGFGWTTLVAAEMVAATLGLGQMVLNASNFLRTDIVVMGIILIGIIAYGFDLLMRLAEARLTPWKGRL